MHFCKDRAWSALVWCQRGESITAPCTPYTPAHASSGTCTCAQNTLDSSRSGAHYQRGRISSSQTAGRSEIGSILDDENLQESGKDGHTNKHRIRDNTADTVDIIEQIARRVFIEYLTPDECVKYDGIMGVIRLLACQAVSEISIIFETAKIMIFHTALITFTITVRLKGTALNPCRIIAGGVSSTIRSYTVFSTGVIFHLLYAK